VKTVLVVCLVLVAIAAIPTNVKADETAAIVIHKDTGLCGMVGSNANGNPIGGGLGEINLVVDRDGKVTLTCKGTGITNLSGQGQHFTGFACGLFDPDGSFEVTTNTAASVSASGQASLSCTAPDTH